MKGQFWSFDIIFAMVIFVFAVVILTFVWYNVSNQLSLSSGSGIEGLQYQAQSLGDTLLSAVYPASWPAFVNISNTDTWVNFTAGIGTGNGNRISTQKMMELVAMSNYNYEATKSVLGVGYDYYIKITGNGLGIGIGLNPFNNRAASIQVVTKPVVIGNQTAQMQVMVWTNTTFGIG